jgi:hypothetical protein
MCPVGTYPSLLGVNITVVCRGVQQLGRSDTVLLGTVFCHELLLNMRIFGQHRYAQELIFCSSCSLGAVASQCTYCLRGPTCALPCTTDLCGQEIVALRCAMLTSMYHVPLCVLGSFPPAVLCFSAAGIQCQMCTLDDDHVYM